MPYTLNINTQGRALIEITRDVETLLKNSPRHSGVAHLFIQHTSASLIIQENADPDVQKDLLRYFEKLAPEGADYAHAAEGPDDMPAHLRSTLTSTSIAVPFSNGRLLLGAWQGIYVFEHRRRPHHRRILVSITPDLTEDER